MIHGPVNTVQEFLETLWRVPAKEKTTVRMYRGQSERWPLRPKLFRNGYSCAKARALQSFIERSFKERCLYLMPSYPKKRYDKLSLYQHYGLPTRLLDWSSNPLMGLFFAVDSLKPQEPTVWIYDGTREQHIWGTAWNQEDDTTPDSQKIVIINPIPHSHRVVAQAGWHTVHPFDFDNQEAIPLERSSESARLETVAVAPQSAKGIKAELRDMGIHAATVYGDLTSVCKEIQDDLEIPSGMRRDSSMSTSKFQLAQLP